MSNTSAACDSLLIEISGHFFLSLSFSLSLYISCKMCVGTLSTLDGHCVLQIEKYWNYFGTSVYITPRNVLILKVLS